MTTRRDARAPRARSGTASLARQPIVDRHGQLHGYELLFRGRPHPDGVFDGDRATAEVLVTAACELGWDRLGGGHPLFLNVDVGLLMDDLIDLAPPEHTVIEVVEQVQVDDAVRARVVQLSAAGYRIALDDFVPGSSAERLLPHADLVKVDVLSVPPSEWPELVARLHQHGLVVVAERVEGRATHELALMAGFDLFQGYWYSRPADQQGLAMSPRQVVCLRLLTALNQADVDLRGVEELVTSDPVLSVRTLRMASSVSGAGHPLSSMQQALVLIGPSVLSGWIALMLVAGDDVADSIGSIGVIVRARACQLVSASRGLDDGGPAFLSGLVLALSDKTGMDAEQMLDIVGASSQIREAVLAGAGPLGAVVRAVDRHISGRDEDVAFDIQMAHLAAVVWGHELLQMR